MTTHKTAATEAGSPRALVESLQAYAEGRQETPRLTRDDCRFLAAVLGEGPAASSAGEEVCPDCNGTGTRYYAREVTDGCDRCNATGKIEESHP